MGLRDDQARERIRQWFLESGMTQTRFAKKVGWSQPTVSSFLLGKHNTDLDGLALMAQALGRTLAQAVGDDEPEETEESRVIATFNALSSDEERAAILQLMEAMRKEARPSGEHRRSVKRPSPPPESPRELKRAVSGKPSTR